MVRVCQATKLGLITEVVDHTHPSTSLLLAIKVYIAPLKSLARERLKEWKKTLSAPPLKWNVLELSGDTSHDSHALNNSDVLICTPEKWDLISRGWRGVSGEFLSSSASHGKRFVREVGLLVIDEIHLLGKWNSLET